MDPIVIVVMGIITLYFLPTLIGWSRGHGNPILLALTNAATGWTVWGWILCLGWSVVLPNKKGVIALPHSEFSNGPDDDGGESIAVHPMRRTERRARFNAVNLVAIPGGNKSENPRRVVGEK